MSDDRDISCASCKKNLGVIRDAKLRIGIAFLCADCDKQRLANALALKLNPKPQQQPMTDFMDHIFGRNKQ